MAKHKFEPSPHKDEAMQLLQEGMEAERDLQELKEEVARKFDLTIRTVERYIAQITNPPEQKPVELPKSTPVPEPVDAPKSPNTHPKGPAPKVAAGKVELTKVATQGAAPTLFVLSGDTVPVMASDLDNAWQYYKEIQKMDPSVTDNFGTAICSSMRHAWRHMKDRLAMDIGNAILDEEDSSNGDSGGTTSGSDQAEVSAARAG